MNETEYRIKELERQVAGLQRQQRVTTARMDARDQVTDRRLRDLEIRNAAMKGTPQKALAEIYDLSAARVNQIVKRVA